CFSCDFFMPNVHYTNLAYYRNFVHIDFRENLTALNSLLRTHSSGRNKSLGAMSHTRKRQPGGDLTAMKN
ncbi:MAG: hypothetical protein L6290_11540, partial [Thermodesulfovibrionales bacterium]|nr:hypothetical protein [Thermodesulfovibrionales bacterium]